MIEDATNYFRGTNDRDDFFHLEIFEYMEVGIDVDDEDYDSDDNIRLIVEKRFQWKKNDEYVDMLFYPSGGMHSNPDEFVEILIHKKK